MCLFTLCVSTVVMSYACAAESAPSYQEVVDAAESKAEENYEKNKAQYKKLAALNTKESLKYLDISKEIVEQAESAFKQKQLHLSGSDKIGGSLLDQILQNSKNLDAKSKANSFQGLVVCVSFSMPKELLFSYHKQVQLYGGRLVVRGLIDNDFKKTIKEMDMGDDQTLVLDINPMIFKKHQVTHVPTILLKDEDKVDKFVGSISVSHALDEARIKGDTKDLALRISKKIKANKKIRK